MLKASSVVLYSKKVGKRMLFKFEDNVCKDESGLIKEVSKDKYEITFKDGEYNIRIYAGDLNDDGDVTTFVHLNDKKIGSIWVNDRTIMKADYTVTVQNGVLPVEFHGKYVCIQGIEISERIKEIPENLKACAKLLNKDKLLKENPLDTKGNVLHTDVALADNNLDEIKTSYAYLKTRECFRDFYELSHTVSSYEVVLNFECDNNTKDTEYKVYKKLLGSGKDPKEIIIKGNTFTDTDCFATASYEYSVAKIDEFGFVGKVSETVTVKVAENGVATKSDANCELNLKVFEQTENKVTLSFSGIKDAFMYRIYFKPEFANEKLIGVRYAKGFSGDENFVFTDEDVVTDREYKYIVAAIGANGEITRQEVTTKVSAEIRKRQLETLDRGLIAVYTLKGVFLAWRLCAYEYDKNAAFNIYANGELITKTPLFGPTDYIHEEGTLNTEYEVRMVIDGKEVDKSKKVKPWKHNFLDIKIDKPADYETPDGLIYPYTANDATVADLDGDGEYEIVLKWYCNGKDNSHKGYSGICYMDAYKLDGTRLWRIDLGPNIRCGAHYTQFMVYDFDADGYAEMVLKTADGTKDGLGNVIGKADADFRNKDGFILEGDEYLTLFDGRTGKALDTVKYDPGRGTIAEYGDSWGNRVDRFLACVAYLDGVHPSVVMCRGYYDHGRPTNLVAYDIKDKKLVKRWKFRADYTQNIEYTNQGFHSLSVGDVDGDGCDEIIYGACVIDEDGTGLYSTGLEHGDAMHVGRFTKDSKGLDFFGIHEHAHIPYGFEAHDAGTGEIRYGEFTGRDTERGLTAKIDPRYEGNQTWVLHGFGLYNYKTGEKISDESPRAINFATWWDGDLLRELFDHDWYGYETCVSIPKLYKWNYVTEEMDIIWTSDKCMGNNGTKGNPCVQASIFGDWREDLVLRGKDSTFLRIYTTTDYTKHRFYTFMHDYMYRLAIAWQNSAYNQPPHTSFYIGPDMNEIPKVNAEYIPAPNMNK